MPVPSKSSAISRRALLAARGLCAAAALWFTSAYLACAALRATYPWEIEWMEGGMIMHAARLLRGLPIYAPPSLDFIAYFYTPLYAYLLAALSLLSGELSFALGRGVSIAASLATMGMLYYAARRERGLLAGVLAVGMYAALFRISGAFYDLARVDSLALALLLAAALVVHYERTVHGTAIAALLATLAVLTKQTSAVVAVFIAVPIFVRDRRHGLVYVGTACALAVLSTFWLEWSSQGWFSFYVIRGHQGHDFAVRGLLLSYWRDLLCLCPFVLLLPTLGASYGARSRWIASAAALYWLVALADRAQTLSEPFSSHYGALWYTMGRAAVLVPPLALALLLLAARWHTRSEPAAAPDSYFLWLTAGGAFASGLNYATQWAHSNCFMPIAVFASLYSSITLAGLLTQESKPRALAGVLAALAMVIQFGALVYDPRAQVPSAADRAAVRDVVAELAKYPGPVFMPAHPLYSYLRDGTIHAHSMGFRDLANAGGVPDLESRLAGGELRTVVVDTGAGIPEALRRNYKVVHTFQFTGQTLFPLTGFKVRPYAVFVHRSAAAAADGGIFGRH